MEEDRGSEKYCKVIIFLFRVCTQLMRAVVTEQINTDYASVSAEKRLGTFLFNKRTQLFPRGRSTHAQDATFENTLYPGYGESTDIDKWDLQLLAFVALRTCDQSDPTLMMDFEELKKIRNALCHSSDGILSDAVYDDYMLKVRTIFKRTLNTLKNSETIGELNNLFKALEFGPNQMFYKDSKTRLISWYEYDKRLDEVKLDRLDVGQENIVGKVDKSFHLLNKIQMHQRDGGDSMVDGGTKMPETEVLINVKMCNPDQEKEISSLLVQLLDSELRNDTELVRKLSEESFPRVISAVQKALAKLSLNGYPLTKVQHGCVVLRLQSSSYAKLKELWYKAMDGTLTWVFRHVEAALTSSYPAVKLDVYIPERDWWREIAELAEALEKHTYRIAAKYDFARELTKKAVEETQDAYVKSAIIQKENLGMTEVSLKIAPQSVEHQLHISEVCKNGMLDERLKAVANALKDAYNINTLEIEVVSTNKSQRFTEPEAYQSTSEPPIRPVSCIAPRSAIKADQSPSVPSIHAESAGGRGLFGKKQESAESAPVRTKRKTEDTVNITMYAMSGRVLDDISEQLSSYFEGIMYMRTMQKPVITRMTDSQLRDIEIAATQHHVELKMTKDEGRLEINGIRANVYDAIDKIYEILRDVERNEDSRSLATYAANVIQWYFVKTDSTGQKLCKYEPTKNSEIEDAYKANKSRMELISDEGDTPRLYVIDFLVMTQYPHDKPEERVPVLRRDIQNENNCIAPDNWSPMTDSFMEHELANTDHEFTRVSEGFMESSGGGYIITKIQRIQNLPLWQQYQAKKTLLDIQNPQGTRNERVLWHGTKADAIDSINRHGYNRSYCGQNATAFGSGVYFAEKAVTACNSTYAVPDSNGIKHVYKCRVLTGEYTLGQQDSRTPPPKPSGGPIAMFDSLVDNTNAPTLYVVFNDTQAYPEYLISFKRAV